MIIGANVALSLGLVGALSIIRFRTPIKDSRDLAYLFWAICIGLGMGAGAYSIVLIMMVVLSIVTLVLEGNPKWATRYSDYLLVISTEETQITPSSLQQMMPASARLKSITAFDTGSEVTFSLADNENIVYALVDKIKQVNGITNVHVVSPDYEVLG